MAQPPRADVNYLRGLFRNVDKDGTGNISATELQSALSNGTWKPFNPETIRMMIGMFDRSRVGTVDFDEFVSLWNYITSWLSCFQSFDLDRSGAIDKRELSEALTRFGYRLSEPTMTMLLVKFDRDGKGSINFDDFIQCCVTLQTLTAAFRHHDTDQDGWIKISYEDFLRLVFSVRM
ncbi:programmed cell death protein 6 isoform X2 [Ixodes scapularis]|nr:programmed cell death protein 6 isoform X2 [Ixodes scapularis]